MPILVYDSGCGPCTDFRYVVGFLDPKRRINFLSLAEADRIHLLDPLASANRYRSFHLLLDGGNVESGAKALPDLVGLLPGGKVTRRALRSFPPGMSIVSSVYGVLSRLHDAGSCSASLGNTQGTKEPTLEYAQNRIKTIK